MCSSVCYRLICRVILPPPPPISCLQSHLCAHHLVFYGRVAPVVSHINLFDLPLASRAYIEHPAPFPLHVSYQVWHWPSRFRVVFLRAQLLPRLHPLSHDDEGFPPVSCEGLSSRSCEEECCPTHPRMTLSLEEDALTYVGVDEEASNEEAYDEAASEEGAFEEEAYDCKAVAI